MSDKVDDAFADILASRPVRAKRTRERDNSPVASHGSHGSHHSQDTLQEAPPLPPDTTEFILSLFRAKLTATSEAFKLVRSALGKLDVVAHDIAFRPSDDARLLKIWVLASGLPLDAIIRKLKPLQDVMRVDTEYETKMAAREQKKQTALESAKDKALLTFEVLRASGAGRLSGPDAARAAMQMVKEFTAAPPTTSTMLARRQ